jgi:hypothetical protein
VYPTTQHRPARQRESREIRSQSQRGDLTQGIGLLLCLLAWCVGTWLTVLYGIQMLIN